VGRFLCWASSSLWAIIYWAFLLYTVGNHCIGHLNIVGVSFIFSGQSLPWVFFVFNGHTVQWHFLFIYSGVLGLWAFSLIYSGHLGGGHFVYNMPSFGVKFCHFVFEFWSFSFFLLSSRLVDHWAVRFKGKFTVSRMTDLPSLVLPFTVLTVDRN
jgi:hypothetical protein